MDFAQSVATIFGVLNLAPPKRKTAPILISPPAASKLPAKLGSSADVGP
jgi:hypothetical protein